MAYDLKLTRASTKLRREIASTSATIDQEGAIVCAVIEDGVEKATLVATVAGTEVPLGYTVLADAQPDRTSAVETVTVPTAPAALEVDLRNTNLVTLMTRAVVVSSSLVLTIDETFAGATANDSVKVDLPTGRLKFHADEAGEDVLITYRYDLTLTESKQRFGERFINNRGLHAEFGQLEVGSGECELFTDRFNSSLAWDAGTTITLGDGGVLTQGGAGPSLNAAVLSVPNEDNPFLGVRIHFEPVP